MRLGRIALALLIVAASYGSAQAATIMIGDNDGYGFGVADNGTAVWPGPGPSGSSYDGRSAAEAAAVNGAQFTDNYSALFPGFGPNASESGSVIFSGTGTILAATLTVDMGDFQSSIFGPISANINGVPLPFAFDDGFQATRVRTFALNAAMIAAANLAGSVILNLNHTGSNDFIAFDYFRLETVPEPGTLFLFGTGVVAVARRLRRRQA